MSQRVRPNSELLLRLRGGLDRKEIVEAARKLGKTISVDTIYTAEKRGKTVSLNSLIILSKVYSVPVDDLIMQEPRKTPDPAAGYREKLYDLGNHVAQAIRLTGADCEYFRPKSIRIETTLEPYVMPPEILRERQSILDDLELKSRAGKIDFFDGPNTRLLDFIATPRDGITEDRHLELRFGPIGWYDFSVVNEVYAQTLRPSMLARFIDFNEIAKGTIKNVRLTNIVDTATTIITSDGYALYSRRGAGVSAGDGMLTCAVAENIHQNKDRSLMPKRDGELLAPFRTVLRGIEEELSPELSRQVDPRSILLLGLAFNLRNFQPDLLFAVVVPHLADQVMEMKIREKGKDYHEISLLAMPAAKDRAKLETVLSDEDWLPGGKASLIRAIEFVNCLSQKFDLPLEEVIRRLANGNTEWIVDDL